MQKYQIRMSDTSTSGLLKFLPLRSFIHNDFWHKYAEIKIDIDRLDESGRSIVGTIALKKEKSTMIEVACSSFNTHYTDGSVPGFRCKGTLLNYNTMESFKQCDKKELLRTQAIRFYHDLMKLETITNSADLIHFFLLSFADLKCYKFYHWFAFPAPTELIYQYDDDQTLSAPDAAERMRLCIVQFLYQKRTPNEPFFIYHVNDGLKLLSECINHHNIEANFRTENIAEFYFCFYDPSGHSAEMPLSWHVRHPALAAQRIKCLRITGATSNELQYSGMTIYLPSNGTDVNNLVNWAGWEVDEKGKYLPRVSSLAQSMSPESLAESAINLNLKLMKWRLIPSLNLDTINKTKCLLLGAGTLGCNVARSLMAWGVTHMTIVDCGRVSLSNPVRQSLYRYEDALQGGKPKATTASERLREINPAAKITGVSMKIPMPGHPVSQGDGVAEIRDILRKLTGLIQEHDVIYLLTDSRESRWLPTMLGAFYGKLVINAALGFDSYLVMRHGYKTSGNSGGVKMETETIATYPAGFRRISGSDLGCYFCNDIVAPGNSMKDRTLDQQCTVTRPAVSNMASALAVELMVSLIQHGNAPAYYRIPKSDPLCQEQEPDGLLGIIPHSIRGNIGTLQTMITATERYANCVACSASILNRYACDKDEFIINIINGTESLETVAGLNKIMSSMFDEQDVKVSLDFESDCSDDS
uniref:Ubiquitin-like modifier-activating enzyme ATG7 n=1 Tax=Anopheles farauti TaxID=69004 RepID=A0A182Q8A0_9DIPT